MATAHHPPHAHAASPEHLASGDHLALNSPLPAAEARWMKGHVLLYAIPVVIVLALVFFLFGGSNFPHAGEGATPAQTTSGMTTADPAADPAR